MSCFDAGIEASLGFAQDLLWAAILGFVVL